MYPSSRAFGLRVTLVLACPCGQFSMRSHRSFLYAL